MNHNGESQITHALSIGEGRRLLFGELYRYGGKSVVGLPEAIVKYLFSPTIRANIIARMIVNTSGKRSKWLSWKLQRKHGIYFSPFLTGAQNLRLAHPVGIVLAGVHIGANCTIFQNVTIGQNLGRYPTIGDNVIIYAGAVIIGNVHVGNNVVIGANSVVTKDIPDNAIVAGAPARIIKFREPDAADGYA